MTQPLGRWLFVACILAATAAFAQPSALPPPPPEPAPGPPVMEPLPAAAAIETPIFLELNKLEEADGACMGFFLVTNGLTTGIAALEVQLFIFDAAGEIRTGLALPFTELRGESSKVGVFRLAEGGCSNIGRLLVNEVRQCVGDDGLPILECAMLFSTASRASVSLDY